MAMDVARSGDRSTSVCRAGAFMGRRSRPDNDGRHLAARSPDGVLLWVCNPLEDGKFCPYRSARPIIVTIESSSSFDENEVERRFKRKIYSRGIRFDAWQFGVVDVSTGDFFFMRQS